MLLNADEAETYQPTFEQLMTALLRTFKPPPIQKLTDAPIGWSGDYYKALVALRPVRDYEAALLSRTNMQSAAPIKEERLE